MGLMSEHAAHLEPAMSLLKICIMSSATTKVPEASVSNPDWARTKFTINKYIAAKETRDKRHMFVHRAYTGNSDSGTRNVSVMRARESQGGKVERVVTGIPGYCLVLIMRRKYLVRNKSSAILGTIVILGILVIV